MFSYNKNIISKSFPNTRFKMEVIDKGVMLGHSNVSIGKTYEDSVLYHQFAKNVHG